MTLLMLAATIVLNPGDAFAAQKECSGQGDRPTAVIQLPKQTWIGAMDPADREAAAHRHLTIYVTRLQSRKVLLEVAEDPEVARLPFVKESENVVSALAEDLDFQIDRDASIITISSRGLPPSQGAIVVNAVVRYACQTLVEQYQAAIEKRIQSLEGMLVQSTTRLEAKNHSIEPLSRLVLEPGGREVNRPVLEAELLDGLRRLRQVRLDRIAIDARLNAAEESDPARSSLETAKIHERQEAMLASERDHLLGQLAKIKSAEAAESERRIQREHREEIATEIDSLRTRLSAQLHVPTVIRTAHP